ncbi:hypothetical protein [Segatella copri]
MNFRHLWVNHSRADRARGVSGISIRCRASDG